MFNLISLSPLPRGGGSEVRHRGGDPGLGELRLDLREDLHQLLLSPV